MTPGTLQAVEARLRSEEGTGPLRAGRFMPYKDSVGVLTIGYGCAIGVTGLSREEAEFLLASRVAQSIRDLDFVAPWWRKLDEVRQGVVLELMYQLGIEKFLGFRHFRHAMETQDFGTAATELLDSHLAQQLVTRTKEQADMIATGVAVA